MERGSEKGRESISGGVTARRVIRWSDGRLARPPVCLQQATWPGGDARLSTSNLFLCRRRILRSGRRGGCRWLRLRLRRFHSRKYGRGPGSPRRKNRKRDRRDHENDRGPSRRPGKNRSRAPRTKRCLAALAAESCSQVAALSALQQNDRDQKEADDNVNGCDQICDPHEQNSNGAEAQISTIFSVPESIRWCGRGGWNYS